MKKFIGVTVAVFVTLALTSCVKMDLNLIINEDATISGFMIFALDESLSEMEDDGKPVEAELFNSNATGVTVSNYNQDGFVGKRYDFKNVPFEEFSKGSDDPNAIKFKVVDDTVVITGAIDFSSDESGASNEEWAAGVAKTIFATADLDLKVTFPGEILKTSGKLDKDGHSVSWKPKIGEKLDLATTIKLPSKFNN